MSKPSPVGGERLSSSIRFPVRWTVPGPSTLKQIFSPSLKARSSVSLMTDELRLAIMNSSLLSHSIIKEETDSPAVDISRHAFVIRNGSCTSVSYRLPGLTTKPQKMLRLLASISIATKFYSIDTLASLVEVNQAIK